MKTSQKTILIHAIACLAFLIFTQLFAPGPFSLERFSIPRNQQDIFANTLLVLFYYLNLYVLLPRYYFTKRYVLYGFILVAYCLFATFIPKILIIDTHIYNPPKPGGRFDWHDMSNIVFLFWSIVFFSLVYEINNRLKKTEREKQSAELAYLKAQVNPHFLFNTLNSIYALALDNSPRTANAVVKLSGLMRYVITEAEQDFVPLEKELNYILDYIELQRLRLDHTVQLNTHIDINPEGHKIAPLILVTFIENAFKYGVNPELESVIDIRLSLEENTLILSVKNNKVTLNLVENTSNGLGIKNAQTRLDLLYPNKYQLNIENQKAIFEVALKLTLI